MKLRILVHINAKLLKIWKTMINTNFEKQDWKIGKLKSGKDSSSKKAKNPKSTLAINSFMTIWLLTLPKNFRNGFDKCSSLSNMTPKDDIDFLLMSHYFPVFIHPTLKHLFLHNPGPNLYESYQEDWNLMSCFEHFITQKGNSGLQCPLKLSGAI